MIGDGQLFSVEGDPLTGAFGICCSVKLPADHDVLDATDHQEFAVKDFYGMDFPRLKYAQAHALLCYREYARHCVDTIFKKHSLNLRRVFSRFVAIYISHVPEMAGFAIRWNERNFAAGTGSPRVKGTPYYPDVYAICGKIFEEASSKGFDFKDL